MNIIIVIGIMAVVLVAIMLVKLMSKKPIQLTLQQSQQIDEIHETFKEVVDFPKENWVEMFQQISSVEPNLRFFQKIVPFYKNHCVKKNYSLESKQEFFSVILTSLTHGPELAMQYVDLKHLSQNDAEEIVTFLKHSVE